MVNGSGPRVESGISAAYNVTKKKTYIIVMRNEE